MLEAVLEPSPLDTLSAEMFADRIGDTFAVHWPEANETLVLAAVTANHDNDDLRRPRTPFSLHFRGTTPGLLLHQHRHPLDHAAFGRLEIFLVPVGAEPDGTYRYEAAFN